MNGTYGPAGFPSQIQHMPQINDDGYYDPSGLIHQNQYASANSPLSSFGARGSGGYVNPLPGFHPPSMTSTMPMSSIMAPSGMTTTASNGIMDGSNLYNNTATASIDYTTQPFGGPSMPIITQPPMMSQGMGFQSWTPVASPAATSFTTKRKGSRSSRKGSSNGSIKNAPHTSIFGGVPSPAGSWSSTSLFQDIGTPVSFQGQIGSQRQPLSFPLDGSIGCIGTSSSIMTPPLFSDCFSEEPAEEDNMFQPAPILQNGMLTPSASFDMMTDSVDMMANRLSNLSVSMPDINSMPMTSMVTTPALSSLIGYMGTTLPTYATATTCATAMTATTAPSFTAPAFRSKSNLNPGNTVREMLQARKVRQHTPAEAANFSCTVCTKKNKHFRRLSNYKTHMKLHDANAPHDRPFTCLGPGCGRSFGKKPDCVRHMRSCFKLSKCHMCPFVRCQSAFTRSDTCRRHYERSCPRMKQIKAEQGLSLEQIVRYSPEFDATILTANNEREAKLQIIPPTYEGFARHAAESVKLRSNASNRSVYSAATSNHSRNGSYMMGNIMNNPMGPSTGRFIGGGSINGGSTTVRSTSGRSTSGRSTSGRSASRRSASSSFGNFIGSNMMTGPPSSMTNMGSVTDMTNIGNYMGNSMGMMVGGY